MTETALYRLRDAAFLHGERLPRGVPRLHRLDVLSQPLEGRLVAAAGRGRLLPDGVEGGARRRRRLYRQELLVDKYQMGRDTIARFKKEPPYAWIVPQEQWDPPTAVLHAGQAAGCSASTVYTADKPFIVRRRLLPGRHVDHPDDAAVRAASSRPCFEEQRYPDLTKYPDALAGARQPADLPGRVPAALRHGRLDAAVPDGREGRRGQLAARGRRCRPSRSLAAPPAEVEGHGGRRTSCRRRSTTASSRSTAS